MGVWNHQLQALVKLSGWWFQVFFTFTPTWGNHPIWLIFSNGLKPPTSSSLIHPFSGNHRRFWKPSTCIIRNTSTTSWCNWSNVSIYKHVRWYHKQLEVEWIDYGFSSIPLKTVFVWDILSILQVLSYSITWFNPIFNGRSYFLKAPFKNKKWEWRLHHFQTYFPAEHRWKFVYA